MKLEFKKLGFKNFLSFGSSEQTIDLSGENITVIIGKNMDTGGSDSRNGVGKSAAIIDSLSYALFGKVIRGISNQRLISKLSSKGQMVVWVEFEKGDYAYRIERTERPGKLFLFRKPISSDEDFNAKENRVYKFDVARGKTETNQQIIEILGFDISLFEYLVVNSSESNEFFKLSEDKQRSIIEPLFGFVVMSEKAKALKENRKSKNQELVVSQSAIKATQQANDRITLEIEELTRKSKLWESSKVDTIDELKKTISELEKIDPADEIETIKKIEDSTKKLGETSSLLKEISQNYKQMKKEQTLLIKKAESHADQCDKLERELESINNGVCPTCNQHWEPDPSVRNSLNEKIDKAHQEALKAVEDIDFISKDIVSVNPIIEEYQTIEEAQKKELEELKAIEIFYQTVEEAAKADTTLQLLRENLSEEELKVNPFDSSIDQFKDNAIKEVDESEVEELKKLIEHYDYLINLLTKRDSFLRQMMIDRWLPTLNKKIHHWLDVLELPHEIEFQPDLTISIRNFHEEFDYGNLSKGERARVRVALNFAFQDVFELMNYPINLLAIDELIDSGICQRGAKNSVKAIKEICNEKNKKAFLITHRDDIAATADDIMFVNKENNISRIQQEV